MIELTAEEKDHAKRFIEDPHWEVIEKILVSYIEPLMDITTIDRRLGPEKTHAEVVARQVTCNALMDFLRESRIVRTGLNKPKVNFRDFE